MLWLFDAGPHALLSQSSGSFSRDEERLSRLPRRLAMALNAWRFVAARQQLAANGVRKIRVGIYSDDSGGLVASVATPRPSSRRNRHRLQLGWDE